MAHYTTNLNLYEKDPATDGSQKFNVGTMMNDNWDKIDTSTGNLSNLTTTAKTNLVSAINEVNAKDSLPSQSGQSGKFLTTNGTTASWEAVQGLPIGTIYSVTCTPDYVPNGALPCDGAEYSKSQFNDLWTNYLTAQTPLLKTCTYAEYATAISTYGSCPMFAIDSVNNKFKVPTIKDGAYITQAKSDSELGKSYNESLPNITGSLGNQRIPYSNPSGALYWENVSSSYYSNPMSNIDASRISFDASRSSSTYQDNAKVQGDNVRLRYFVQVATGQINQSQMDWSAWASGLQGKLNTDHSNDTKPYLKTTYVNGTSGYNIWSNGYCEQWGNCTGTSLTSVTFLKTFRDINYIVLTNTGCNNTSSIYNQFNPYSYTTTSFYITWTDTLRFNVWKACGYLAEGEY